MGPDREPRGARERQVKVFAFSPGGWESFVLPTPPGLACRVRGRTGQGKPLSVRFAHSPGFSGMVYPTCRSGRLKIPELAEGFYCPARARAPAHEVQRDFPGLRCQPPRSAPQRRGFPVPRGHAPGPWPSCAFLGEGADNRKDRERSRSFFFSIGFGVGSAVVLPLGAASGTGEPHGGGENGVAGGHDPGGVCDGVGQVGADQGGVPGL